ncbi:hypothetical protein KY321_01900 [Candidatus Woesearchaeota archaeon]|nr:hypothetical protein [Candidatus Woesearchaeota archaeon]
MGLLPFFKKTSHEYWKDLDTQSKELLIDLRHYLNHLIKRINLFQYIFINLVAFKSNKHEYDLGKKFITENRVFGQFNINYNKRNKHFFRQIKNRINTLDKYSNEDLKIIKIEKAELTKVYNDLKEVLSFDENFKKEINEVGIFKHSSVKLKKILNEQKDLINSFRENFSDFYKKTFSSRDEILKDYNSMMSEVLGLRKLFGEEFKILFKDDLNLDNVSNWHVELLNKLKRFIIFHDLSNIINRSSEVLKLFEERQIKLFHSTSKHSNILPLSELMFIDNFYACGSKSSSLLIKKSQDLSGSSNIKVVEITIPISLFKKFFREDSNSGNPSIPGSVEAYEESYYMSVSKFREFNFYYNEGVIDSK